MAHTEAHTSPDAKSHAEKKPSRRGKGLTSETRVDPPHLIDNPDLTQEPADQVPSLEQLAGVKPIEDEPAEGQIRLQADQLATHLRDRQKQLDHRESELNSRIARWDSETRTERMLIGDREVELAEIQEKLALRERELLNGQKEVEKRLTRLASAEAALQKHGADAPAMRVECADRFSAEPESVLAIRRKQIEDADARLAELQSESRQLQEKMSEQRKTLAEETEVTRREMAEQQCQTMADVELKRQAVQRRSEHVDQYCETLKQMRTELGRMHHETLEIRLATEELWVQLSGTAPPAALTQSLGKIRAKLADQYSEQNAKLLERRKELETIRTQLAGQYESFSEHKRRCELWVSEREEQCQQQAARLVAREQQLNDQETEFRILLQGWKAERVKYQQELRRLRAELADREESAVPA